MALDKVNLNLFSQASGMQAINPTKSVGAKPFSGATGGSAQSNNPFKGETVGVNTNIGVGDTSFVSNQLGRSGMAKTLAFA